MILLGTLGLLALAWTCVQTLKFTENSNLRPFFIPYIVIKVLGGIAVGIVYFNFYTVGDTINYYQESLKLQESLRLHPGEFFSFLISNNGLPFENQPRAQLMLKATTLLSFLGFSNYYVMSLYLSVLCGLAGWKLADTLLTTYRKIIPVLIAILFLPLTLFWGSGILKESISTGLIFLILHFLIRIVKQNDNRVRNYVYIILLLGTLFSIKYYYAAVLGPIVFSVLLVYQIEQRLALRRRFAVVLFMAILLVSAISGSFLHPNLNADRVASVIVDNHDMFISKSRENNIIRYRDLEPTWKSISSNLPLAILSGLYRPFPSERGNLFKRVIGAGNLTLLLLTIAALRQKWPKGKYDSILLFGAIIYILTEAAFLSLSTPNFGTLSRYKTGYIPLFLFLILLKSPVEVWLSKKTSRFKWINQ